jgi:hypothetical protein
MEYSAYRGERDRWFAVNSESTSVDPHYDFEAFVEQALHLMPDLDLVLVGGGVLVPVVGSSSRLAVSFVGPVNSSKVGESKGVNLAVLQ